MILPLSSLTVADEERCTLAVQTPLAMLDNFNCLRYIHRRRSVDSSIMNALHRPSLMRVDKSRLVVSKRASAFLDFLAMATQEKPDDFSG